MIPATKAFGVTLGLMAEDQVKKLSTMKQNNQLTKQARKAYHEIVSFLLAVSWIFRTTRSPSFIKLICLRPPTPFGWLA